MSDVTIKELLGAGVHFGHQTRRWNPKMAPYIYGEKNGIHIFDLPRTLEEIVRACDFVRELAAGGGTVLFVGTKRQVQSAIEEAAVAARMPYVNFRWLGGMLTNFKTINRRIFYMKELTEMENNGDMEQLPKKERLRLRRELVQLEKALGGVAEMTEYWRNKIQRNMERDRRVNAALTGAGWTVIRVTDRAVMSRLTQVGAFVERAAQRRFRGYRPPGVELLRP